MKILTIFLILIFIAVNVHAMGERDPVKRNYKKVVKISRKACENYHCFKSKEHWNDGHKEKELAKECYFVNRERLKVRTGKLEPKIDEVIDEHVSIYLNETTRKARKFMKKHKIAKAVADTLLGGEENE